MFRLAHLTDLHIPPLPPIRLPQLLNKRLTGWINWQSGRHRIHDIDVLNTLLANLYQQKPDHITCTGDLANLGLPAEWPQARKFLEKLGSPDQVSFVPGNHDAYGPHSLPGLLAACTPYLLGDDAEDIRFPYVRRRSNIALIGLSSAIPTPPFKAYGKLGSHQLTALEKILADLGQDTACCRIIMIHHPPYCGGTKASRNLKDAAEFEKILSRHGAELVLFGHNHVSSLAYLEGPKRVIPVIGAPSASSSKKDIKHRAAYHLYLIDASMNGVSIVAERHGICTTGEMGLLERRVITPAFQEPEMFGTQEQNLKRVPYVRVNT